VSSTLVAVRALQEPPLGGDVGLLDGVRAVAVEDPVRRRQRHNKSLQRDVEADRGAGEGRLGRRAAQRVGAVGGHAP